MPDATPVDAATPQDEEEDGDNDEDDENNEVEDGPSPSQEPEPEPEPELPSRSGTPRRGRPGTRRGRRGGRRGGLARDIARLNSEDGDNDTQSATPKRRGGFRGHRGGRGGRYRAGGSRPQAAPVDVDGNPMEVADDEVVLPTDPEGEEKIDKYGRLQGGREYRVRTFTILGRGERLYMLSTEPARCIGFRDSYLFFQKHKHLYKIITDEEEKKDLIERDLIPHSYKGRSIGVVTARSVFREFGAQIVIGGKKITDDYQVQAARDAGEVEGELAAPEDRLPRPGEPYNRNQYVAWHGASAVYHTNAPNVPGPAIKTVDVKRRRTLVTSDNWMLEHAREAR
jgi:chromatin structure-remodeling complex protein RSC7